MSEGLDIQPTGAVRSGDLKHERWDLIVGTIIRPLYKRGPSPAHLPVVEVVIEALEALDDFIGWVGWAQARREVALEVALGRIADAIQIEDGGDPAAVLPELALARLARTCHEGAVKYGSHNWLRGFPIWVMMNHGKRHLVRWLAGDRSEDHLGHALWNTTAALHYWHYRPELCIGLAGRNYTYPGDDTDNGRKN